MDGKMIIPCFLVFGLILPLAQAQYGNVHINPPNGVNGFPLVQTQQGHGFNAKISVYPNSPGMLPPNPPPPLSSDWRTNNGDPQHHASLDSVADKIAQGLLARQLLPHELEQKKREDDARYLQEMHKEKLAEKRRREKARRILKFLRIENKIEQEAHQGYQPGRRRRRRKYGNGMRRLGRRNQGYQSSMQNEPHHESGYQTGYGQGQPPNHSGYEHQYHGSNHQQAYQVGHPAKQVDHQSYPNQPQTYEQNPAPHPQQPFVRVPKITEQQSNGPAQYQEPYLQHANYQQTHQQQSYQNPAPNGYQEAYNQQSNHQSYQQAYQQPINNQQNYQQPHQPTYQEQVNAQIASRQQSGQAPSNTMNKSVKQSMTRNNYLASKSVSEKRRVIKGNKS